VTAELPPSAEHSYGRNPRRGAGDSVALIAGVAFVLGVLLNGYIALSILDDGQTSSAATADENPIIVPANPTAEPTATGTPLPDRTDCEEIRGTDYRSPAERQFFLDNCLEVEPTPTVNPTELPALDGGTNTEAIEDAETPTPEP
jgi:hypothetical protein